MVVYEERACGFWAIIRRRKYNERKEEEALAAEENGEENKRKRVSPLNNIGQVGRGLRRGAESGNAHPVLRKKFTNCNCTAPTWVGQRRVKSILEGSRVCVMMTSKLEPTCKIDIFAMELDKLSSSSAMIS
jgi:hypothetical protein